MRSVFPEHRRVILPCSVTSLLASFVSCMGRFYSSILLLKLPVLALASVLSALRWPLPAPRLVQSSVSHPPLISISPSLPSSSVASLTVVTSLLYSVSFPISAHYSRAEGAQTSPSLVPWFLFCSPQLLRF